MWYKDNTGTEESQVSQRIIIGVDMGGSLWATAIHNCETKKESYHALKDWNGKRKEDRLYDVTRALFKPYLLSLFLVFLVRIISCLYCR